MQGEDIAVPSVFIIRRDKRIAVSYVGESAADRPSLSSILEDLDKLR